MKTLLTIGLMFTLTLSLTAEAEDGPRTGYFRKSLTPNELLGPEGAQAIAEIFSADKKLSWQLSVPKTYDSAKPAGVIVFVSRHTGGGGLKSWTSILEDRNIIWIGARDAGDASPLNERMLKAMLAQAVLALDYKIDPERVYVSGFSGGAQVASILATTRPEVFKGGLFMSGAVFWGENTPTSIDAIRQNRFVFTTGSNDVAKTKVMRTAKSYEGAGILKTETIVVPNMRQSMPGPSYFELAVDFLDARDSTASN